MENQNNRQGNDRGKNGGMMNKIGQGIENMVDAITGKNHNKGRQNGGNNNNR